MESFKMYNQFINESKKGEYYNIILNDINIYIDEVIYILKKEFKMSTWFQYSSENSVTLGYFISSDNSYENIKKIKKFLHDNLIYFRDMKCYDDDRRLVLKFIDPGEPIKFKFHY